MIVDSSAIVAAFFQSYAIAKLSGLPLLFVGEDFSQTDIRSAS